MKDVKSQVPQAICELVLDNGSRTMIVNRAVSPFDNADLRRGMALSLDRKAFVDILTEGQGAIGGAMELLRFSGEALFQSAASFSNWAGLVKLSAEWRLTGL